jgi:hypothetical protein
MTEKLGLGTILIVVYCILMGILQIVIGALMLQGQLWNPTITLMQLQTSSSEPVVISIGILLILTAFLWFVLAIGLLKMETWAFWLAIIMFILSAPTIISLIVLVYLILNKEKFVE